NPGLLWDGQRGVALREGEVAILTGQGDTGPPVFPSTPVDDEGQFAFGPMSPGTYVLRASSHGYVTAKHRFTIPHQGNLRFFRFPLTPVRVVVRDIYATLSDELLEADEEGWGRLTPREASELLLEVIEVMLVEEDTPEETLKEGIRAFRAQLAKVRDAERGEGPPLSADEVVRAFVALTEEVYYSQRLHDEAIIIVAERLAERVRTRVAAQGEA
ncbi:MAG: carboxypeptidase-like regulatory domain-containing protein, partial [Myxococcota bacterium]